MNAKSLSSKEHLVPLELYQLTPRTNCGDCGFSTCLAFATHVVKGEVSVDKCPHMEVSLRERIKFQIKAQLDEGYGLKKDKLQIGLDYLFGKLKEIGLKRCAEKHGFKTQNVGGTESFILPYFNREIRVTDTDISAVDGEELDPWDKVFILNYVLGEAGTPSGEWVGMESLPNSISKVKTLEKTAEKPIAEAFLGKPEKLLEKSLSIGGKVIGDCSADCCVQFDVFPRLSVRLSFWDGEASEGFEARAKFLFDKKVLSVIDLESLCFICEKITKRLKDTE